MTGLLGGHDDMRFMRADALRLVGLFALAYLAVSAVMIAAFRSFDTSTYEALTVAPQFVALTLSWIIQRHILNRTLAAGLRPAPWWLALVLGVILIAAFIGVLLMAVMIGNLPGAPGEGWLLPETLRFVQNLNEQIDTPVTGWESASAHLLLLTFSALGALLLYWPAASLLRNRLGQTARPYLIAICAAETLTIATTTAFHIYGFAWLMTFPEPTWAVATALAAALTGAVYGMILSLGFFALSSHTPETPSTKPESEPDA